MTATPLPRWKFERVIDGIPCVPTVEAENNMQIYAITARADLEAENKRLREALQRIESMCAAPPNFSDATIQEVARAALEKQS